MSVETKWSQAAQSPHQPASACLVTQPHTCTMQSLKCYVLKGEAAWFHPPAWATQASIVPCSSSCCLQPQHANNMAARVSNSWHATGSMSRRAACLHARVMLPRALPPNDSGAPPASSKPRRRLSTDANSRQQPHTRLPDRSSQGKQQTHKDPPDVSADDVDAWATGIVPSQGVLSVTAATEGTRRKPGRTQASGSIVRRQRESNHSTSQKVAVGTEGSRGTGSPLPQQSSSPAEVQKQQSHHQKQPSGSPAKQKGPAAAGAAAAAAVGTATAATLAAAAAGAGVTGAATSNAGQNSVSSAEHEAAFAAAVAAHGLNEHQVSQLLTYLDYMLETNKVMNLTAVRDRSEALTRHLVDSLAILPVIEEGLQGNQQQQQPQPAEGQEGMEKPHKPLQLIDVGTGAGLPGMVLAVARPQWRVTLLDTLRKRCDFLQRAAEQAGLTNVTVVWSRAEEGARKPELREAYDVAVARAVADTRVLAELCLPYVKLGGSWVAPKGPNPEAEVAAARNAVSKLGGSAPELLLVQSFSPEGQRTAVRVRKTNRTPATYPRSPGTPNKNPL